MKNSSPTTVFHKSGIIVWGDIFIYFVALLFLTAEWLLFRNEVTHDNPSVVATFIKGLPELGIILLPFFFLKPSWRWLTVLPVLLLSLFFEINLLYFRVFYQLIPFDSFFLFQNFDSTLTDSATALFKSSDLTFLICPIVYIALVVYIYKEWHRSPSFSKATKITAVVVTLLGYVSVQAFVFVKNRQANEYNTESISESIKDKYFSLTTTTNNIQYDTGLVHYLCLSTARLILQEGRIDEYTPKQKKEIADFLNDLSNLRTSPDSVFADNSGKNLIFIIVESLNSDVIGRTVNGVEVTPSINGLIGKEGSISALKVVTQVKDGRSSDGQLLYNTGLMPLQHGVAAMNCGRNKYISLAKLLDKKASYEYICEYPDLWNHTATTKQYGFDKLYSVTELGLDYTKDGYDKAVFDLALETLSAAPQPFYAEITTMSSHLPFEFVGSHRNDSIMCADGIPDIVTAYLNSINYFDRQLGEFIERLKEVSLYDNSIIIIAADHDISFQAFNSETDLQKETFIPFIAINTGIESKITDKVGQCDVFPTILDIMGVENTDSWRGVGLSILNPKSSEILQNRAANVSDLILRGYGTDNPDLF